MLSTISGDLHCTVAHFGVNANLQVIVVRITVGIQHTVLHTEVSRGSLQALKSMRSKHELIED